MRISPLNSITFSNNQGVIQSVQEGASDKKKMDNSYKLAIGISSSAAIGLASYFIFRRKPQAAVENKPVVINEADNLINKTLSKLKSDVEDLSSKFVIKLKNGGTKVQYSTPVNDDVDTIRDILIFDKDGNLNRRVVSKFDAKSKTTVHRVFKGDAEHLSEKPDEINRHFLTKEITIENYKPFMRDIIERNFFVRTSDNNQIHYQDFYRKGKLFERTIYKDKLGSNQDTESVVRYNFAYDKGELSAVAKQDLFKDGHQHGIYQNGGFDPFPILVKNKGEKDFKDIKIYTFEPLCEHDARFNPDNI